MQHEERFGKGIYRNFAAEMEKFRKGKDSHILCEFENAWKFGSLFSVWDAEGCVCVADDLGRMRIEYPKGEGKTYTIQEPHNSTIEMCGGGEYLFSSRGRGVGRNTPKPTPVRTWIQTTKE